MAEDKKIPSTGDVVEKKLEDKKFEYGSNKLFEQQAYKLTDELPAKVNALKTRLFKEIGSCLPKDGMCKPEEVDGLVDKVYDTAYRTIVETAIRLKPMDSGKNEDLDELVKSYLGGLDKKALKSDFKEQVKQTGYIDPESTLISRNILRYPINTFQQKRQKSIVGTIEETIESKEGFEDFKKYIQYLGTKINKPVTDKEIWMPDKALDTWLKLENIRRSLERM